MVVTYHIKLFRTRPDRHNGILMSLLLLFAETIKWHKVQVAIHHPSNGIMHTNLGQL